MEPRERVGISRFWQCGDPTRPEGPLPPIRAITRGPEFHWFGHYDKLELVPTGRYVLGMAADFEHRAPEADDTVKIGMVDTGDGDRWIELGESRAWCWQQGMLQWRPMSRREVVWNDRLSDRFVCHILDVLTRERRAIPHPIYTIGPDGRTRTETFRRPAIPASSASTWQPASRSWSSRWTTSRRSPALAAT